MAKQRQTMEELFKTFDERPKALTQKWAKEEAKQAKAFCERVMQDSES